jgi:hypothetical protein
MSSPLLCAVYRITMPEPDIKAKFGAASGESIFSTPFKAILALAKNSDLPRGVPAGLFF